MKGSIAVNALRTPHQYIAADMATFLRKRTFRLLGHASARLVEHTTEYEFCSPGGKLSLDERLYTFGAGECQNPVRLIGRDGKLKRQERAAEALHADHSAASGKVIALLSSLKM